MVTTGAGFLSPIGVAVRGQLGASGRTQSLAPAQPPLI